MYKVLNIELITGVFFFYFHILCHYGLRWALDKIKYVKIKDFKLRKIIILIVRNIYVYKMTEMN